MIQIHHGDCLDVMRGLADGSVDSVVTDPPYGLAFMGKAWDHGVPGVPFWSEMRRVLKPGGHLVAFGGTRTYHRMACAIEDAGFEIRDQLGWLYGSGFPKSHNLPGGLGNALKPAWEPICLARKPLAQPTVAANVAAHGTGALNIDGCRVDAVDKEPLKKSYNPDARHEGYARPWMDGRPLEVSEDGKGRWPANIVHDGSDEVLEAFARFGADKGQSGPLAKRNGDKFRNTYGGFAGTEDAAFAPHDGKGTAARFFYSAKATKAERAGSKHPTVKPIALMRWLVRLVTPPGGTVLDCFAGSGTTGVAADREGFNAILIEREAEYVEDINRRIHSDAPLFAETAA